MVVVGGQAVTRSIQLFLDCLRQCGTIYDDSYSSNDENNEDDNEDNDVGGAGIGDGVDVDGPWRFTSNNDSDNRCWEPLIPCQNALLLAVEAATCILSLDTTTSPIVFALPKETRK